MLCSRPCALSLVHNIDAGLSVKTASKAPLYAGADAGIEISSIPASASSVSVERQYCEPGFNNPPKNILYRTSTGRLNHTSLCLPMYLKQFNHEIT